MNRARYTTALSALLVGVAVASIFLLRGKANSDETKAPNLAAASESAADAAKPGAVAADATSGESQRKASEERGRLLETIGCLTSAHYFQTYLNIGFIADGKTRGTYSDKDARTVLDSVLSLLHSTDKKLESLGKVELDKEDRERLRELQTVSDLLRQQGKELQTYWDTGKDENAAKYEILRKNAWTTMTRVMGIGE